MAIVAIVTPMRNGKTASSQDGAASVSVMGWLFSTAMSIVLMVWSTFEKTFDRAICIGLTASEINVLISL